MFALWHKQTYRKELFIFILEPLTQINITCFHINHLSLETGVKCLSIYHISCLGRYIVYEYNKMVLQTLCQNLVNLRRACSLCSNDIYIYFLMYRQSDMIIIRITMKKQSDNRPGSHTATLSGLTGATGPSL